MKKLTVCILTYRRAAFLKIAIEKILEQTFTDFDLIIVDDCSPDNTEEVVNAFDDPRITYIRNETNLGFNANYNKALTFAKSPYVLLTHDDDEMTPNFLEREVAVLDQHPEVVMVAANTESINEHSETLRARELEIYSDILYKPGEYIDDSLNNAIGLCCPTFMFRRSFLDESGIRFRDVGPGSDIIICLETNLEHTMYLIADPIFRFRAHSGQDHVQLKNCMRADLKKHVNTWRLLKEHESAHHHLPQIAYSIAHTFPVHIIADTLNMEGESAMSSEEAVNELLKTLEPDEQAIVASNPKFQLMYKEVVRDQGRNRFSDTEYPFKPEANHHLAMLMEHNDRLLSGWLNSSAPIGKLLADRGVKKVALWGVGIVSLILEAALKASGIETAVIIDNDTRKRGYHFLGLPIDPYQGSSFDPSVDTIITCIESYHDLYIRQQIKGDPPPNPVHVYSWKDLAMFQSAEASLIQ